MFDYRVLQVSRTPMDRLSFLRVTVEVEDPCMATTYSRLKSCRLLVQTL
jgi:hypothetical protein